MVIFSFSCTQEVEMITKITHTPCFRILTSSFFPLKLCFKKSTKGMIIQIYAEVLFHMKYCLCGNKFSFSFISNTMVL